jgi:hypothetical protein
VEFAQNILCHHLQCLEAQGYGPREIPGTGALAVFQDWEDIRIPQLLGHFNRDVFRLKAVRRQWQVGAVLLQCADGEYGHRFFINLLSDFLARELFE